MRECVTGKSVYSSIAAARRFLRTATGRRMRIYPCPLCGGYHATSITGESGKGVKKARRQSKPYDGGW